MKPLPFAQTHSAEPEARAALFSPRKMQALGTQWVSTISRMVLVAVVFAGANIRAERPNVILFIADDVSWNDYGCYGNAAARTPHIDSLVEHGIRFDQAYLTASSCSPSRSSIITGRYPHNNGKAAELHKPISGHLPWFPQLLRDSGYYTALSGKHHMTSTAPSRGEGARPIAFDHVDGGKTKANSGGHANWVKVVKERPREKPFFFWFASYDAHRGWDADRQWNETDYGPKHRGEDVVIPPFLRDDAATRADLASYYNEVTRFDHYIGKVIEELRQQNVFENTLIFVLADNGRPFPRAKTRLHDSGMKTALVAHWPDGIAQTGACRSLVSVIDLAPTILQLAECRAPETMQGVSLRPLFADSSGSVRQYAFSEHNWHDYEALGRSVRHDGYLLVKNSRPDQPWQGPADSVRSPSHRKLLAARDRNELTAAQQDVFTAPRPMIELYDIDNDPHQLNNLAGQKDLTEIQQRLTAALDRWMDETCDSLPERISPDTFDRETGDKLPSSRIDTDGVLTPGEDRDADRVNNPGPR